MSRKGGIRKRMMDRDEGGDGSQNAASSSDGRVGGLRKRVAKRVEEVAGNEPLGSDDLPLNESLKRQWARGKMTSPQVQEIAMSAMQQGARGVKPLAAAGTYGKHPHKLATLIGFVLWDAEGGT